MTCHQPLSIKFLHKSELSFELISHCTGVFYLTDCYGNKLKEYDNVDYQAFIHDITSTTQLHIHHLDHNVCIGKAEYCDMYGIATSYFEK